MTEQNINLIPCPNCGEKAKILAGGPGEFPWSVLCGATRRCTAPVNADTKEQAIMKWNAQYDWRAYWKDKARCGDDVKTVFPLPFEDEVCSCFLALIGGSWVLCTEEGWSISCPLDSAVRMDLIPKVQPKPCVWAAYDENLNQYVVASTDRDFLEREYPGYKLVRMVEAEE